MKRLILLLLLTGCGATESVRRTFPVEVVVKTPDAALDSGWVVTGLEGSIGLEDLRFFEGEPLTARRSPLDWFIGSAWAHPGHFAPGDAKGELLQALVVDVTKKDVQAWGTASAVTGTYGSAQLGFGSMGVRLKGTATRGTETVKFDTGKKTFTAPLAGVPFIHHMTNEAGRVHLTVDVSVVLSRIAFDKHQATPDAQGVVTFSPQSAAFNGFDRGFTDAATFRFTWQTP